MNLFRYVSSENSVYICSYFFAWLCTTLVIWSARYFFFGNFFSQWVQGNPPLCSSYSWFFSWFFLAKNISIPSSLHNAQNRLFSCFRAMCFLSWSLLGKEEKQSFLGHSNIFLLSACLLLRWRLRWSFLLNVSSHCWHANGRFFSWTEAMWDRRREGFWKEWPHSRHSSFLLVS